LINYSQDLTICGRFAHIRQGFLSIANERCQVFVRCRDGSCHERNATWRPGTCKCSTWIVIFKNKEKFYRN